jgi:hypothetical protein
MAPSEIASLESLRNDHFSLQWGNTITAGHLFLRAEDQEIDDVKKGRDNVANCRLDKEKSYKKGLAKLTRNDKGIITSGWE